MTYPNINIAERLCQIIDWSGMTNAEFGKMLGIHENSVYRRKKDAIALTADEAAFICTYFGLDANWFLLGIGHAPWEDEDATNEHI